MFPPLSLYALLVESGLCNDELKENRGLRAIFFFVFFFLMVKFVNEVLEKRRGGVAGKNN